MTPAFERDGRPRDWKRGSQGYAERADSGFLDETTFEKFLLRAQHRPAPTLVVNDDAPTCAWSTTDIADPQRSPRVERATRSDPDITRVLTRSN